MKNDTHALATYFLHHRPRIVAHQVAHVFLGILPLQRFQGGATAYNIQRDNERTPDVVAASCARVARGVSGNDGGRGHLPSFSSCRRGGVHYFGSIVTLVFYKGSDAGQACAASNGLSAEPARVGQPPLRNRRKQKDDSTIHIFAQLAKQYGQYNFLLRSAFRQVSRFSCKRIERATF